MANEAVIIELLGNGGDPVDFTCATGTSISKGCILKLTDPRTASASTAFLERFAGIAAADKLAGDESVNISGYTHCIADLRVSGAAITAGDWVVISGANLISAVQANTTLASGALIIGKALETATGGTAETIEVLIGGNSF